MSDAERVEGRIKAFLEELSPQARALLLSGLKTASANGEADFSMRRLVKAFGSTETEIAKLSADAATERLRDAFFAPIRPLIVEAKLPTHQTGRISWHSCTLVWRWLMRDLMPEEVATALATDPSGIDKEARRLRSKATGLVRDVIRTVSVSPIAVQRLVAQVGGERVYRDLRDMLDALDRADWMTEFLAEFPEVVTRKTLDENKAMLAPIIQLALTRPADTVWALSALMHRLETPALLLRMALALVGSNDTARLVKTPYAVAVDLFLSELEIETQRIRDTEAAVAVHEATALAMERFHLLVRDLEGLIEIPPSSGWGKRLAGFKAGVSNWLEQTIMTAPGLVRRALRARDVSGQRVGYDADLIADTERALRIVSIAAFAKDSLAVNTALGRVRRDIEQAFEALSAPLIEELRNAFGEERDVLMRRTEAVVRLAEIHFGPDYSTSIRRSRHTAIHGPIGKLAGG